MIGLWPWMFNKARLPESMPTLPGPVTTRALDPILRGVSRSIFLTLRVAPSSMRRTLGIGYLFCRAADTVADTRLLSRESRRDILGQFRAQFAGERFDPATVASISTEITEITTAQSIPEERQLLERLVECFEAYSRLGATDRRLLRTLVTTLTQGMEMDLARFPAEESGEVRCLETDDELDRYTYYVAGCVGEFWTELQCAHVRALSSWDLASMREKGIRFGKGLQMTNILRDLDRDLSIGRCYFPRSRLEAACVSAEELRDGRQRDRLEPILAEYLEVTVDHYRAGWEYTLAIPRRAARLRLACAWPLLLGLATLRLLARTPRPYAPGRHLKISRREVRRLLRQSTVRIFSNKALDRMYRELEGEVIP